MAWLTTLLIVVQVIAAIAVIVLVLLQHGKGADMGAAFGGGASGSLFGATGSANFLSRSTGVVATVFFLATLGLAYTSTEIKRPASDTGGVMGTVPDDDASTERYPDAEQPSAAGCARGRRSCGARSDAYSIRDPGKAERRSQVVWRSTARTRRAKVTADFSRISPDFHCPRGGIGRHTILRGWRRKPWEFESPRGHHLSKPHSDSRQLPSHLAVHPGRACDRGGTTVARSSTRSAQA